MRRHKHSVPRLGFPYPNITASGASIPPASTIYKTNGKFYYKCGTCKVIGGGMSNFSRCVITLQAHDTKAHP